MESLIVVRVKKTRTKILLEYLVLWNKWENHLLEFLMVLREKKLQLGGILHAPSSRIWFFEQKKTFTGNPSRSFKQKKNYNR